MRSVALALVFGLVSGVAFSDEEWDNYATKDGVVLSKRKVAGSKYLEYQATTTTTVAPATFIAKLWAGVLDDRPPSIADRQVLKRTDNELVVYDQIKAKVVSDREVVLKLVKSARPDGGFTMRFDTASELGPPPDGKRVRLPAVRGEWVITPEGGGSRLLYRCYSEPGGSVPAFLVRGAQQDQVLVDVKRALARTSR